jgi:DNA gyrase subunit A
MDVDVKEEDFVMNLLSASTHNDLLFFTDKGRAYQIKMYDLPEGKRATRGKHVSNFISLAENEKITSILAMPKDVKKSTKTVSMYLVTKLGQAKRVAMDSFTDVRRSGILAIGLDAGDELLAALFVEVGDSVILTSKDGQSIRFDQDDIRIMGRAAGGVRAMNLDKNDRIVSADVIKKNAKDAEILVMTEHGYGKKTPESEYKIQNRGGSGIKTVKVTDKTGELIVARVVTPETEQIIAMSKKSQVIKIDANTVPSLGRDTQGVRIMKPRDGDSIASLTLL